MSNSIVAGPAHQRSECAIKPSAAVTGNDAWNRVLPALRRLDITLQDAVAVLKAGLSTEATADPFHGLYITDQQVERYLSNPPGTPSFMAPSAASDTTHLEGLSWLRQWFHLSTFDLELIVIALAPELDLRYERLYAYLQNDVTRRRPTVDLALNLLCDSAEERISNEVISGLAAA